MTQIGQRVLDGLVSAYQRHVSAGLNAENDSHCLYTPSCSAYSREALKHDGAFIGALDTLGRLARCNGTFAERNREQFITCLDDPSSARGGPCPRTRIEYANDAARERAEQVQALLRKGDAAEAREMLRRTLHVALEDRPGQHDTKHFLVSLEHRPSMCAHEPSPARSASGPSASAATPSGSAASALASTRGSKPGIGAAARRLLGTVVGGVVGGVIGAVAEGLLTGFVLAPLAATKNQQKLHAWLSPRVGAPGADALGTLADRATVPANFTHRVISSATRSHVAASAVALVIGVPLGLVQGIVHGAAFGAFWGARVGRAV